MIVSAKAPFFLFLLFSSAVSLNSYTYTYPTTGNPNVNHFALGNLTASDVITFLIEFPGASPGSIPSRFYIQLNGNMDTPVWPTWIRVRKLDHPQLWRKYHPHMDCQQCRALLVQCIDNSNFSCLRSLQDNRDQLKWRVDPQDERCFKSEACHPSLPGLNLKHLHHHQNLIFTFTLHSLTASKSYASVTEPHPTRLMWSSTTWLLATMPSELLWLVDLTPTVQMTTPALPTCQLSRNKIKSTRFAPPQPPQRLTPEKTTPSGGGTSPWLWCSLSWE